MGGRTYKKCKKCSSQQTRLSAKSRLNILGSKKGEYKCRFISEEETMTPDGMLIRSGSPSPPSKTDELSLQLSESLKFTSEEQKSSGNNKSIKSTSSYRVSLKNNVFARKTIKLTNSVNLDSNASAIKQNSEKKSSNPDAQTISVKTKRNKHKRKRRVKSNKDLVAEKIASVLGESSTDVIRLVIETIGAKEAMKICNLSLDSKDCIGRFESKKDGNSLEKPLDLFLMFIDLEESISKDKRIKLLEKVKRIRKASYYTQGKSRSQRRRDEKLFRRKIKSMENQFVNLNLSLSLSNNNMINTNKNDDEKQEPTEKKEIVNQKSGFVLCPSRLQVNFGFNSVNPPQTKTDAVDSDKIAQTFTVDGLSSNPFLKKSSFTTTYPNLFSKKTETETKSESSNVDALFKPSN